MEEKDRVPRILIVDDQPSNILLLKAYLRALDYEVLEARSGEEALALAVSESPDLIAWRVFKFFPWKGG